MIVVTRRPARAQATRLVDQPVGPSPGSADGPDEGPSARIGRGHPPYDTRFKPGQSGNPRGRPKGSKSLAEDVRRQMRKTAVVTIDGKPARRTYQELMAQRIAHDAAKGSLKAIELAAKLTGQAPGSDAAPATPQEPLALDEEAFRRIHERLGRRLAKGGAAETK
jgi:hypothetical protein